MKVKKEYSVLVLIILVLSAYLILRKADRTHYELPEITPPAGEDISKFVFSSGQETVILERNDDIWRILPEGYIADKSLVDRMSEAVAGFSITTLAAESSNYALYDLEGDKKIILDVYCEEKAALSFEIGKKASTNRHTFVRFGEKPEIYQVKGDFRSVFNPDKGKLRDKTVLTIDKDQVTALKILSGKGPIEVMKNPDSPAANLNSQEGDPQAPGISEWQTAGGMSIDERAVTGIVSALTNIRCDSYINDMTKADLNDPVFSVIIHAGGAATLSIFEMSEDKYPAISSQNDYPFFLPKWKAEQIIKGAEELLPVDTGDSDNR